MDLNTTWFILIAVLLGGYAILDGFDLGVGVLHLFARDENERRIHINSIGPVWDGNEVWLLTGGGAMFAAFPIVYATVFSGFYLAIMLLLFALVFRAVSLEFRGQVDSPGWKKFWDWSFGLGSLIPALIYGVAVGNILRGLPVTAEGSLNITFIAMLNPYSLLVGILGLVMFVMHGAAYSAMKTEGDLQQRMSLWLHRTWMLFVVLYILATSATFFTAPYLFEGIFYKLPFWIFFLLLLGAIVYFPLTVNTGKYLHSFLASSVMIASMIGLTGISLYPRIVPSGINLANSLTIYNASSTPRTLLTMLIIALIGMPVVIGYTIYIYKVFKGKVVLEKDSY